ncbi:MAG: aspartate aminotransferase family protein [Oscillospiraceae bacterium]|nr:aspartate aminotransferase family protein [Ruminococcus sp.]MDY6061192.1 aspartate aminotransferase family protein [Oscillospiraceae bacterium]
MDIFSQDKEYIANTYGRLPVEFVSGKGSVLRDSEGKEYIDLGSGIAVNIFGIADDEWVSAVTSQLTKLQHTSNYYYTEPQADLAKQICERTNMKKVFFGNSGAEANECAIKTARKYGNKVLGFENPVIITLKNSFHGRTVTTLTATGQDVFHKDFGPFTPGFVYAEANNREELLRLSEENDCCAVMMELIQGEGGVMALDKDYVEYARELCTEKNMLLIIDEVQTGNGRSGCLYSFMNYGIQPDIFTTAKGLGGGLPIGAAVLGEKVKDILTAGDHGSTFGGNPVCAAGALNVFGRIDDELLTSVKEKSEYIISELKDLDGVDGISGMGLMLGIKTKKDAKAILKECLNRGVLVLTAKDKVRLLPALNIPMAELKKGIEILKEVISA